MESGNRSVVVEGTLLIDEDNDSSDEDDENDDTIDAGVRERLSKYVTIENEDEELEVFVNVDDNEKKKSPIKQTAEATKKKETGNRMSLVDAMAAAVNVVEETAEGFGFDEPPSSHTVMRKKPEAVPKQKIEEEDTGGAFGIKYKPYGKKKKDYDTPAGPSFEDEHEFEKELKQSEILQSSLKVNLNSTAEEEDEFGDFPENNSSSSSSQANLFSSVLERAAAKAKEEEEAVVAAALAAAAAPLPLEEEPPLTEEPNREGVSVFNAARAAMAEISSIYTSGLGDQEIHILDANKNANQSNLNKAELERKKLEQLDTQQPGLVPVIEEGDEEEEVLREQQEEARAAEVIDRSEEERRRLEEEWDRLDATEAVMTTSTEDFSAVSQEAVIPVKGQISVDPTRINYAKAEEYFRSLDLSQFASSVVVEETTTSKWNPFGGPTKLKFPNCEEERALPFLIAQVEYDPSVTVHLQILQTIFKLLVGSGRKCPVVGPHWEEIGFQGRDPCTDINRSMKMFAALQMLHLVDSHGPLARKLHALSNITPDPGRGRAAEDLSWPMFCVSIQFTKETIQLLRAGHLNKLCNQAGKILPVLHNYHRALFVDFARRLQLNPSIHHAEHLATIHKICTTDPLSFLKSVEQAQEMIAAPAPASFHNIGEVSDFTEEQGVNVGDIKLSSKASKFLA